MGGLTRADGVRRMNASRFAMRSTTLEKTRNREFLQKGIVTEVTVGEDIDGGQVHTGCGDSRKRVMLPSRFSF